MAVILTNLREIFKLGKGCWILWLASMLFSLKTKGKTVNIRCNLIQWDDISIMDSMKSSRAKVIKFMSIGEHNRYTLHIDNSKLEFQIHSDVLLHLLFLLLLDSKCHRKVTERLKTLLLLKFKGNTFNTCFPVIQ